MAWHGTRLARFVPSRALIHAINSDGGAILDSTRFANSGGAIGMKFIDQLFPKTLPPSERPVAGAAAATGKAIAHTAKPAIPLHATVKMSAAAMRELFPSGGTLVSAIFDATPDAVPSPPAAPDTLPERQEPEPQRPGVDELPQVLSVSDELREAIFPKQKVMVSVVFDLPPPAPPAAEPEPPRETGEVSVSEHDYPIV